MTPTPLIEYRLKSLEDQAKEIDDRLRVIEIAYAKVVGWAAGAAFAGSALFQLLQWAMK